MESITTHQAKTHLSSFLKKVEKGAEIQILRGSVPVARLISIQDSSITPKRPSVGTITSTPIEYSEDAFSPLTPDELKEWGI
jgi:prevent-host-death family protein